MSPAVLLPWQSINVNSDTSCMIIVSYSKRTQMMCSHWFHWSVAARFLFCNKARQRRDTKNRFSYESKQKNKKVIITKR